MTTTQFFEKFDLFAGAPDAVAKMRSLILELAVRGQLTSATSHPSDPSAQPFRIPQDWQWVALGDVFTFEYGDNLPAAKRSETGEYPVYGSNGIVGTHHVFLTEKPAIIVGRKGSAGALNVANGPSWTTDVAYFVCPPKGIDLYFTHYLFSTLRLDKLGKGIKPGLNRKEAYALRVPLPPLAEQKRIVAKIDELMALCDQLEVQQQERETKHTVLAQATLARFAEAPTPTNLNLLFHSSFSIQPSNLRKTILTLAVQGKLVPQDPKDEPAEKLIVRINLERSGGKPLHRDEMLTQVDDNLLPHEVPASWTWARFRDVATIASNLVKPNAFLDYPHLAPDNIEKGNGVLLPCQTVREDKVTSAKHRFFPGQIVYSKIRPNLSKVVIVDFEGLCSADMYPVDAHIDARYLQLYMLSGAFLEQAVKSDTRVAMPKINQAELNNLTVPVPPLAEQKRIVAKVKELMALVDALEAQQAAADQAATHLLDAVVAELAAAA